MSLPLEVRHELLSIMHTVRDGKLTSDQSLRLKELVVKHDEARTLYLDWVVFTSMLRWMHGDVEAEPQMVAVADERTLSHGLNAIRSEPNRSNWLPQRFRYSARQLSYAITGLLAIYFITMFGSIVWDRAKLAWRADRAATQDGSEHFAMLLGEESHRGEWNSIPEEGKQTLKLADGEVELLLKQGARVIVQGPAEFEVCSSNSGFLRFGKLTAKVPQKAVGFAVSTPSAEVIDLGTEFGMEVATDGATDVHVFEGTVDFVPKASSNLAQNQRLAKPQRLRAGQAARTDFMTNSVVGIDFVSDKFARTVIRKQTPPRGQQSIMIDLKQLATASQSSDYFGAEHCPAGAAIDGDSETYSHTSVDDATAWWQLDLGRTCSIAAIVLQNRGSCRGWLRDVTIKILADDGRTVVVESPTLNPENAWGAGKQNFDEGPPQIVFELSQMPGKYAAGRFVRVERAPCQPKSGVAKIRDPRSEAFIAAGHALAIGEVQVFEPANRPKDDPSEAKSR